MIDKASETWRDIVAWVEDEGAKAAGQLAMTGVALPETEFLRGRLSALADLLDLAEPIKPPLAEPSDNYGLQGADEG